MLALPPLMSKKTVYVTSPFRFTQRLPEFEAKFNVIIGDGKESEEELVKRIATADAVIIKSHYDLFWTAKVSTQLTA